MNGCRREGFIGQVDCRIDLVRVGETGQRIQAYTDVGAPFIRDLPQIVEVNSGHNIGCAGVRFHLRWEVAALVPVRVHREDQRRIFGDDPILTEIESCRESVASKLVGEIALDRVIEVRVRSSGCNSLINQLPNIVRFEFLGDGVK